MDRIEDRQRRRGYPPEGERGHT